MVNYTLERILEKLEMHPQLQQAAQKYIFSEIKNCTDYKKIFSSLFTFLLIQQKIRFHGFLDRKEEAALRTTLKKLCGTKTDDEKSLRLCLLRKMKLIMLNQHP